MTMMSSLKALLFSSPASGATIGTGAIASPGGDGGDFAALLGGLQPPQGAVAASGKGAPLPMPNAALLVPMEDEAQPLPAPITDANATPVPQKIAAHIGKTVIASVIPQSTPVAQEDAGPVAPDEIKDEVPSSAEGAMSVIAPLTDMTATVPQIVPPAVVPDAALAAQQVPQSNPAQVVASTPSVGMIEQAAGSVPQRQNGPSEQQNGLASDSDMTVPVSGRDKPAPLQSSPMTTDIVSQTSQAEKTPASQTVDVIAASMDGEKASVGALVRKAADGALPPLAMPSWHDAPLAAVPSLATAMPTQMTAPIADKAPDATVDDPAQSAVAAALLPDTARPAPVRSEALSLLQLVREHFGRNESATAPEKASQRAASASADPVAIDSAAAAPTLFAVAAPTPAPASFTVAPASVDLGGTLTGQVVDMGVQGQWIDGLAKDIATLSADGAQGRFQVRSDHLGAVQVDIRPGATGASVSLTVASDGAQQALQADGNRLIADAALSSFKINDLRVERGPVPEAQRADSAGQQSSGSGGQSQAHSQTPANAQAMGQGLSQGMGQNRSGQRDNFTGNHKAGADTAVLPQADSREGEAPGVRQAASRARYA